MRRYLAALRRDLVPRGFLRGRRVGESARKRARGPRKEGGKGAGKRGGARVCVHAVLLRACRVPCRICSRASYGHSHIGPKGVGPRACTCIAGGRTRNYRTHWGGEGAEPTRVAGAHPRLTHTFLRLRG
jgi:hypothetical protein